MIARLLGCLLIVAMSSPALAQERVRIGTVRSIDNGALLLAAAQGDFKTEGLDVELKFYGSPQQAVTALAAGEIDLASAEFTATAFNLAGKGTIKIVAAQAREKRDFEGNEIVASPAAYGRGLHKPEDLAGRSVAIAQLGSAAHYQLAQVAAAKKIDFKSIVIKLQPTPEAVAKAVASGQVDAAVLPVLYARELLTTGQAMLVGWVSEGDESQFGALFVSAKMISQRRAVVESFVRAYRRGAADFTAALLRKDRYGKRVSDAKSKAAALLIAPAVFPTHTAERVTGAIETSAYYVDPPARFDAADVARQIAWFKAQGLIDAGADARMAIDDGFTK